VTEYAVAIMLPPEHARWVLGARALVLGEERPYAPHVTVKSPFVMEGDPQTVFDLIATIVRRHESFRVDVVGGIGHFGGPVENVIYLPVTATPELVGLHYDLAAGIAGVTRHSRSYGSTLELDRYVPHVTIAGSLTDEQLTTGLSALRGNQPAFSFVSTHVTLGSSEDGRVWTLLADYPLRGAPRIPHFIAHDTATFEPD
jgi:2'-5' RNA ligase